MFLTGPAAASTSSPRVAGNILELASGQLGLIDYGQTKRLSDNRRLEVARAIVAVSRDGADTAKVAAVLRGMGFRSKHNKPDVLVRYGRLFFDSDVGMEDFGCATPQLYLLKLSSLDPLEKVPDSAGECLCCV